MNIHKNTLLQSLVRSIVIFVTIIILPLFCNLSFSGLLFADAASDLINSAKQLYNQQKYEQSRVAFDDFLRIYPSHILVNEAKFYLADSYLYLKKYDTAINLYSQLASLPTTDPLSRSIQFRLGEAYYTKGDYITAKKLLVSFLQTFPQDLYLQYVLYYLGDIEIANNQPEAAEYYFTKNIELFPNGGRQLENKIGLASAKNLLNKIAESDAIFGELLKNNDPNILEPTFYQYGVALYERGDTTNAIATLSDFLVRWKNSILATDVLRVLTRCYVAIKDNNKALQTISTIPTPTVDDNLMKIRLLIRLKQSNEAENLLTQTEKRTDAPPHQDEIIFLKSVLQYFNKNWSNAIALLEEILLPKYSVIAQNNSASNNVAYNVSFGYSTAPHTNKHILPDEVFLHACAYLALAYARTGNKPKAAAILNEMTGNVANTNQPELSKIVNDTYKRIDRIYTTNSEINAGNDTLATLNPGKNQQWTQTTQRQKGKNKPSSVINLPNKNNANENIYSNFNNINNNKSPQYNPTNQTEIKQPLTTGTDIERFWIAYREFENKQWHNAATQLDQILKTNYFEQLKYATINYNFDAYAANNTTGKLDAATFAKACSMLVIARANLKEIDKATIILTAFANKIDTSNTTQQDVLHETETQFTNIIRNNNSNANANPNANPTRQLSTTEQRRIIKECNSLFNSRRYEQVELRLRELLSSDLSEQVLAEALLLRGRALILAGNEREGIKILERIKSEFVTSPQYKEALWNLGLYYESAGDSVQSVEYFQLLIDEFPNYKDIDGALYYVALDDIESGNGRKGATYLLRIYKNYQAGQYWSHAVWTLAYEEYKKKNYTQAETYLQKVLQHPPDYAILDRTLYLKGEIALQRKDYKIASQAFQEVINLCPDSQLIRDADRNLQIANRNSNNIR